MSASPTAEEFNAIGAATFPGLIGVEIEDVARGRVVARLSVKPVHHAPNGYLHAAVVVGLADTSCGYGCMASLPEGGVGFTTIELKTNFVGTALDGAIRCEALLAHGGRTTQVWDATVTHEETGRVIGLFRCTQLIVGTQRGASRAP